MVNLSSDAAHASLPVALALSLSLCPIVASHAAEMPLELEITGAPIVPDGLLAGAVTDVVLSFADRDPAIPGIALKQGATLHVFLPPEIRNTGLPVVTPASVDDCTLPVLENCSTAAILEGWPQSPTLPLADVAWDASAHALVMTAASDTIAYASESPGAKQIHLITLGFVNPSEPGDYPLRLEIRPDPANDDVHVGQAMVSIEGDRRAVISPDSHVNEGAPPRHPNTIHQSLAPGEHSLNLGLNLWNAAHAPIVGASLAMDERAEGRLVDASGETIGSVRVDAPRGASGYRLVERFPSAATETSLAGRATGRMALFLETDPRVTGDYTVSVALDGGNEVVHRLVVR